MFGSSNLLVDKMRSAICLAIALLIPTVTDAQQTYSTPVASPSYVTDQTQASTSSDLFPSLARDVPAASATSPDKSFFAAPVLTVGFSLTIVLGLFAGLIWLSRRYGNVGATAGAVPGDVMESLGSTMLDARTRVNLLRCGSKILIVAQTATGVHPLGELDDPSEVNAILSACKGESSFADALEASQKPAARQARTTSAGKRSHRLFATA